MGDFEKVLLGIFAVLITFLFWPGLKRMHEQSSRATERHWGSVIVALCCVAAFVVLLIFLVGA